MDKPAYFKLSELNYEGLSYNKLWRSVETLREAEIITTFTGNHGAICLTLHEKSLLDEFLKFLETTKGSQKEALYLLHVEVLEKEVDRLKQEKLELQALVEVKPSFWSRLKISISSWFAGLRRQNTQQMKGA